MLLTTSLGGEDTKRLVPGLKLALKTDEGMTARSAAFT